MRDAELTELLTRLDESYHCVKAARRNWRKAYKKLADADAAAKRACRVSFEASIELAMQPASLICRQSQEETFANFLVAAEEVEFARDLYTRADSELTAASKRCEEVDLAYRAYFAGAGSAR